MPRFSSTGLRDAAGTLQQREVLHVARADLDHVGILLHQVERLVVHGFGDDQQAEAVADLGQNLQAVFRQSLERVGRSARLVGAAAEEARAGAGDVLGGGEGLLAALDGARAGHDGNFVAADGRVELGKRTTVSSSFRSRLTSL